MPIELHAPSLYLATGIIDGIAALLMLRAMRRRDDAYLAFWAAHASCFGAACTLFGLRDTVRDPAILVLGAPLALLGLACIWAGCRRLLGRPAHHLLLALPPLLWLAAIEAPAIQGWPLPRVSAYHAIALPLLLGATRDCWQAFRTLSLGCARDLAIVLLAAVAWSGWRLTEGALLGGEPLAPLAGLVTLVLGASFAFLGLGIAREKAAGVAAEAFRRGREEVERLLTGLPAIVFVRRILPDGTTKLVYRTGDLEAVTGWPAAIIEPLDNIGSLREPAEPDPFLPARLSGEKRLEWKIRQPDGGYAWLRTTVRVLEECGDGSALLAGYVVNIDAKRRATEREAEARRILDETLAAAPVAVFRGRATSDGGFARSYLSRGIERLTGWPWETVNAPGGLQSMMEAETRARVAGTLRELLQAGESRKTYRLRHADGRWIWARTTMTAVERHRDGTADIVGYIADITAEREAEAKAVAAARLASVGETTSGLAHELMQPLLTMSLAAENALRALDHGDPAAARPRLQRITDQVLRAKRLIDQVRRFARGQPEGEAPAPVDLAAAVDGALVLVGEALRQADIALDLDLGDPPPRILGHAVPLEQVLVNLLRNARDALDALPPGAPRRIRIEAGPAAAPGMVRIAVSDSGGGIPDAVMARLFEPFVSTKGPEQGTGLGLSICHGLVKGMGGSICARNEAAGACFTLILPAAPAIPAAAEAPASAA